MARGKIGAIAKGTLHERLGIPAGQRIPMSTLEAAKARAEKAGDTHEVRQIQFAINARSFDHDGK